VIQVAADAGALAVDIATILPVGKWEGACTSTMLLGRRARRDVTIKPTIHGATVQDIADRAALDQYFAQMADDTDQSTDTGGPSIQVAE